MKYILLLVSTFLITSCALFVDEYEQNQRKVIAYLLSDLPIPQDATILKEPSVILGTGNTISGRISLSSDYSPAENLIFFGNETPGTGWTLASSKIGSEIVLVYTKEGRYATIDIKPTSGFGSFLFGNSNSSVIISIVHSDAISDQNPFEGLDYSKLPDLP
tara:strand:+ start:285 stop:767 length:483 start_codon:yes stop_codon:yes gene_type:complete